MRVLKFIGWTLLVIIVLSVILIVTLGVLGSSEDDLEITVINKSSLTFNSDEFSILSFPLSSKTTEINLNRIFKENENLKTSDFILFQNANENSKGFDQRTFISDYFDNYNSWFSYTKKILLSLFPIDKIKFNIYSGSMTLSKYVAKSSVKRLLPSVVDQTFSLTSSNPSIQVLEFKTANDSELFIINLDNIKTNEMTHTQTDFLEYLKEDFLDKLPRDAYIIISGNWNYILPGIVEESTKTGKIPLGWTRSGWQWLYDENNSDTYGMLLSDNITIKEFKTYNEFEQYPFSAVLTLR